jgi:RNA polymerase sigma-70 factor, ECF subfamily
VGADHSTEGQIGRLSGISGDDDSVLLTRVRSGDRAALDALLRRHHDRLYAVCRRITGSDADAADALQNALIAIVKGINGFDGRAQLTTWTYRIAVNAALDEVRRRTRRPVVLADTGEPDPDDSIDAVAGRLDADAALRQLSPDHRAAVVLRDVCGLDYAEIGEVLRLPAGTVRSRIARGRAALVPFITDPGTPKAVNAR